MPFDLPTGIRSTQRYIILSDEPHKFPFPQHFATVAALNTVVTDERLNIADDLAIWPANLPLTVATEPAGVRRRWTVGADGPSSHARTVVFPSGATVELAGDTNTVLATTGAPAGGTGAVGDVAFDQAAGLRYTKTGASTWGAGVSVGGSSGGSTAKAPLTATFGATTTIPADTADFATLAASGDTTLAISGTPTEGQALTVAVRATGGASRAVTLPGGTFVIPSSSTVTSPVTVAANTETLFAFRWSASAAKWRVVSLVAGY